MSDKEKVVFVGDLRQLPPGTYEVTPTGRIINKNPQVIIIDEHISISPMLKEALDRMIDFTSLELRALDHMPMEAELKHKFPKGPRKRKDWMKS